VLRELSVVTKRWQMLPQPIESIVETLHPFAFSRVGRQSSFLLDLWRNLFGSSLFSGGLLWMFAFDFAMQ
jgi:hypothetical protein